MAKRIHEGQKVPEREDNAVLLARLDQRQEHIEKAVEEIKDMLEQKYVTVEQHEMLKRQVEEQAADAAARRKHMRMMIWGIVLMLITQFSSILFNREALINILQQGQAQEAKK
jgi:hypothetical protein